MSESKILSREETLAIVSGSADAAEKLLAVAKARVVELEADAFTVAHLRTALQSVRDGKGAGAHLTDSEVAGQVRMLTTMQLDHEMVCVMARDRIIALSDQVHTLTVDRDKWKDDHALQLQRWQGAVEREQAAEKQLDETQAEVESLRRERDLARADTKWFNDLVNQIQVNIGQYKICGMVPQPGTPEYLESQITYICNVHADTIHTLNLMTSELAAAIEAGKADKALIDKMESLAWSKKIGNGLAIFPSTDRGGVPGWVIQDLGDEDGSNLGDSLSETQSTLRAAMQAAQVEKPE